MGYAVRHGLLVPDRKIERPRARRQLPDARFTHIWVPKPGIIIPETMAVGFGSKATTVKHQTTNTSPITNTTFTVAAGSTVAFGVFLWGSTATGASTPTAMTLGGVTMTALANILSSNGLSNIYLYGLVNPPTGAQTISCTFTAGTTSTHAIDLDGFSFTGTDTSSLANCVPSASIITDATNDVANLYPASPFTITTATGDAICCIRNADFTGGNGIQIGTSISTEGATQVNYQSLYNLAVGASTQGQFATISGPQPNCGIAIRISLPVAAAAAAVKLGMPSIMKAAPFGRHVMPFTSSAPPQPSAPVLGGGTLPIIGVG